MHHFKAASSLGSHTVVNMSKCLSLETLTKHWKRFRKKKKIIRPVSFVSSNTNPWINHEHPPKQYSFQHHPLVGNVPYKYFSLQKWYSHKTLTLCHFKPPFKLSLTPSESIQSSVIVITHHPYKTTAANAIYNWTQTGNGNPIPGSSKTNNVLVLSVTSILRGQG